MAGTLVAPGVGTVAGAAAGGAEGAITGATVGAGIGYAIGTTAHDLATKMSGSAEPPRKGSGRAPEIPSGSIPESKLSGTAQKWLGEGPNEISPGRWVSNDGLRQFRFGAHETKDLQNVHAHFEAYDRPAPDGGHLTENSVVKAELNK